MRTESWFTPDAARAFARLGFPATSFRLELSLAKLFGVLALLIPAIPGQVKEWAYAGFAFNLLSALVAHASIDDTPASFVPLTITMLLATGSYLLWTSTRSPAAPMQSKSTAIPEPAGGYATR